MRDNLLNYIRLRQNAKKKNSRYNEKTYLTSLLVRLLQSIYPWLFERVSVKARGFSKNILITILAIENSTNREVFIGTEEEFRILEMTFKKVFIAQHSTTFCS